MNLKLLLSAAVASVISVGAASANTNSVVCPNYVIVMTDDVVIRGTALAGSTLAFERVVCERSASAAEDIFESEVVTIPVFIEELGIASRVTIFGTEEEPDDDDD